MRPAKFNDLPQREKWQTWDELKGSPKWYCPKCRQLTDGPHRAAPFSGASIHCSRCDHELTRRTSGGQSDPFRWHLGKIPQPKLDELPNGTLLRRGKTIYCLQYGLDQRIVVDVNTGFWLFIEGLQWRTYEILYKPPRP